MTINPTIEGVPRELLERLIDAYACHDNNPHCHLSCDQEAIDELRALLNAPEKLPMIDVHNERLIASLRERVKELEAAQPQGEPVDDCETFEYQLDMLGPIDRCNVSCGSYGDKYHQWDDAGPYVEYEDHVKHIELYKREVDRLSKLYAEQPAPVAVMMPERLTAAELEELEVIEVFIHGQGLSNLAGTMAAARQFIDEVTRLNKAKD